MRKLFGTSKRQNLVYIFFAVWVLFGVWALSLLTYDVLHCGQEIDWAPLLASLSGYVVSFVGLAITYIYGETKRPNGSGDHLNS